MLNKLLFFLLPTYLIRIHLSNTFSINLLEIIIILTIISNFYTIFKILSFQQIFTNFKKDIFSLPIFLILIGFTSSYLLNQINTGWQNWSDGLGKLLDLIVLPIIYSFSFRALNKASLNTASNRNILTNFFQIITSHLKNTSQIKKSQQNSKTESDFAKDNYLIRNKKSPLGKLLFFYCLSTIFISIFGIFYFLNNQLTFDHRLTIFFQSPNQLAIFLSPAFLISLFQINQKLSLTNKKTLNHKIYPLDKQTVPSLQKPKTPLLQKLNTYTPINKYTIIFISIILLAFNIYLTFSLGAWIALLLASLYLLLPKDSYGPLILKLFFSIFILSTICILNVDLILHKINYQPQIPATSYDSRLTIYQADQKIISTSWLFGIGPANFQNIYLSQQKNFPAYPQWAVPHAHNNFLHFWIEGGLLAAIGFFILTLKIFLPNKKMSYLSSPIKNPLLLSVFIYFIIHGTIDTSLWLMSSAIIFWTVILHFQPPQPPVSPADKK
jgi:O-antigen ligase